jgi:uncharacterized membrane protein
MVKYWDARDLEAIRAGILEAEKKTSGEIRVHLSLRTREDALADAKTVFKKLKMHKTRLRNGVLILVDPKNKRFAVLGDEGIHAKTGDDFWRSTRDAMQAKFASGRWTEGVLAGVKTAGEKLAEHFPAGSSHDNELVNNITQD